MRNKKGFTLAETLISLAIIGVIAALTLPNLNANVVDAQIGPKLAKAVSTFEQANQAYLNAQEVDAITDAVNFSNTSNSAYVNGLTDHMKASIVDNSETVYKDVSVSVPSGFPLLSGLAKANSIQTKDGMLFFVAGKSNSDYTGTAPHKYRTGAVYVDINGISKPNEVGTDIFAFSLFNDGSLIPVGLNGWMEDGDLWTSKCSVNSVPSNPIFCTAHIFANNLKVLYK